MKKLEDALFTLKWSKEAIANDYAQGQKTAIKFCIRKHQEGWTLGDFNRDLEEAMKLNMKDEYIQGIVAGLKFNIKNMEETENEQSYANTN